MGLEYHSESGGLPGFLSPCVIQNCRVEPKLYKFPDSIAPKKSFGVFQIREIFGLALPKTQAVTLQMPIPKTSPKLGIGERS